jgi:hypothetical protein
MFVDRIRLKAEIRAIEPTIRAQKRLIRTSPVPWTTNLARPLLVLKARATLLYAITAHGRGRLHLRKCGRSHAHLGLPTTEAFTLADQERFIGDRWSEFSRVGEAA